MQHIRKLVAVVCLSIVGAAPAHGWPAVRETPDPVPGLAPVAELDGKFLAFAPEGKLVATISWPDMRIALWDPKNKKRVREIETGYPATNEALAAFSPDGKSLAESASDKYLVVWDVSSGRPLAKLPNSHRHIMMWYLAFAPDGKTLYAYDKDAIRIYDTATWRLRQRLQLAVPQFGVALSPDGQLLGRCTFGTVEILDATTTKPKQKISSPNLQSESLEFSPDSKTLATTAGAWVLRGIDGTAWRLANIRASVTLWDVATGKEKRRLPGAHTYAKFSPDGKLLVTGGPKGPVFWSTDSYSQRAAINTPAFVYFSPDGKHIVLEQQQPFDGLRMYELESVLTKARISPNGP